MNCFECSVKSSQKTVTASDTQKNIYTDRFFFKNSRQNENAPDKTKRLFASYKLEEIIERTINDESIKSFCNENDFYFYGSGWQSWGFGGELEPGKYLKPYRALVPPLKQYIEVPGISDLCISNECKADKKMLSGQFVIYFRWQNIYAAVCSTGNVHESDENIKILPPVNFSINRKDKILYAEVSAIGKKWNENDAVSALTFFAAGNYFELQEIIQKIYYEPQKERIDYYRKYSLSKNRIITGGWESWYNHYNKINQKLILEDLDALDKTKNLVNEYTAKKTDRTIFQVDDGWEISAGDWEINKEKFPDGMKNIAQRISEKGFVPGIWFAPFIIDSTTEFFRNHREWILKDEKGNCVPAGFNFPWGVFNNKEIKGFPFTFYCLDLSREDVLEYLDGLIEKIINEWGYRYLKLDFLYAGMLSGKYMNDGASYEIYSRAVKMLTSRKKNSNGEDVAYLGCGCPFELSFNDFPLSRIGPDTKEDWDFPLMKFCRFPGRPGVHLNLQSTLGHAFWNEGIFINDPDVVFLRNTNISLTQAEKEMVAVINYIFAGQIMHSDDPCSFDEMNEGKFTQHVIELYHMLEDEKFGVINVTSDTYYIFSKSKKYCGIVNLSAKKMRADKNEMLLLCFGKKLSENAEAEKKTEKITSDENDCLQKKLVPVINHSQINGSMIITDRHSLTLFELDRI